MACSGDRGQEVRAGTGHDRKKDVFGLHIDEACALQIAADGDGVEDNVDTPRLAHDGIGMGAHGSFVQRIDLLCLDDAPHRSDLVGHGVDLAQSPAGEKQPRAVAGKLAGGGAAQLAAGAVDDGDLVVQ